MSLAQNWTDRSLSEKEQSDKHPARPISLASTVVITEVSRRTWWRRISNGSVRRLPNGDNGRANLALADVVPISVIPLSPEDIEVLAKAEGGDADAQGDIGSLFALNAKHEIAHYWLSRAATNGSADAMQWLGATYIAGRGVVRDKFIGLMWIDRAASLGHEIAREQMRSIRNLSSPAAGFICFGSPNLNSRFALVGRS